MMNLLEKFWAWKIRRQEAKKWPIRLKTEKGFNVHKFQDGQYAIYLRNGKYLSCSEIFEWSDLGNIDQFCKRSKSSVEYKYGKIIGDDDAQCS